MTLARVVCTAALAVCATVLPVMRAPADGSYIDRDSGRLATLETPGTVSSRQLEPAASVRFFNQPEGITYAGLSLRYGLRPNLEVGLRAETGATRSLATSGGTLRYGGQDVELFAKYDHGSYAGMRLGGLVGVSVPNTPAQNQAALTLGASATGSVARNLDLTLNPRAVFLDDNTIVGVGIGGVYRVTDKIHVVGDWTGIVSGDNTRSVVTGARKRGDLWGAALRLTAPSGTDRVELDLGYTNATGGTTGFSLTPGLGDSAAFYVALRVRR
jgi:hypothetical protein